MSTAAPHGAPSDAFRLFFPLGIVLGVAGVSIWPAYFLGLTPGFSGRAHAFVQADGFLYAFVAGFLLTSIGVPRLRVNRVLATVVGPVVALLFAIQPSAPPSENISPNPTA